MNRLFSRSAKAITGIAAAAMLYFSPAAQATEPAQQHRASKPAQQYIIPDLDFTVNSADGKHSQGFRGAKDNLSIDVQAGSSFTLNTKECYERAGNGPNLDLDMILKLTDSTFKLNPHPIQGKSQRVFENTIPNIPAGASQVQVLCEEGKEIKAFSRINITGYELDSGDANQGENDARPAPQPRKQAESKHATRPARQKKIKSAPSNSESDTSQSYGTVDLFAGFSNLKFEAGVDPEANATAFGARINYNSPKARVQLSGESGSYALPEGDSSLKVSGGNIVGKLKAGKLPVYLGAELGASDVSVTQKTRGIERVIGLPRNLTTLGNIRLGLVAGDNGFAGNWYLSGDTFFGILTTKDQVQTSLGYSPTRSTISMLEQGATGEVSAGRGRISITGAYAKGKNSTEGIESVSQRLSAVYRQPVAGNLSVMIGASVSKVKMTQQNLTISDAKDRRLYAGASIRF